MVIDLIIIVEEIRWDLSILCQEKKKAHVALQCPGKGKKDEIVPVRPYVALYNVPVRPDVTLYNVRPDVTLYNVLSDLNRVNALQLPTSVDLSKITAETLMFISPKWHK